MKLLVKPGIIVINEIFQVVNRPEVIAFEADLHSKYPGPFSMSYSGNHLAAYFMASDRTLKAHPELKDPTEIIFEGEDGLDIGNWRMIVDARRYSIYIALWQPAPAGGKVVYSGE